MHGVDLIVTIAAGFSTALVLGYLTHRIGLSPIVGYLLAGLVVGPHTPGPVVDTGLAEQLAEIGVILLMFGVGLQFHFEELLAVRAVAVPGAVAQSAIATGLGALVAHLFGWSWAAAVVFGVALSVASTVVLVRVLADNRDLHTATGHIAVGWLVVEDLFTVLVLVVLPGLFGAQAASGPGLALSLGLTAVKVAGLVAFTAIVGSRVIPWLLDHVAETRSRELFTLTVLALALGIAVGSAAVFGVSMALGAFLAGMVVGRSEYSLRAASEALPMRDAFAVLFFVSVGMLLDPGYLLEAPLLILATLGVVLVGKPAVALAVVLLMRYPLRTALAVSVALAQIGEFSFILAALGRELGVLPAEAMNVIVTTSIVSILLNPVAYRSVATIHRWATGQPWLSGVLRATSGQDAAQEGRRGAPAVPPSHRAVVVGYGPTGRTLTRLLRDNGVTPAVIELNMETVRHLREEGLPAVYGDASQHDVLDAAGIADSRVLIITADLPNIREVIRLARALSPRVRVLTRTGHLRDVEGLRAAGADEVFSGEGEVALALTEAILERLGATAEQMDRERARAHDDLFGVGAARQD
jgi:CPA2 family monovalent cation:H+ antiporter-2